MELSAIGEEVFAVESIIKKRVRKVSDARVAVCLPTVPSVHTYNMLKGRGHTRPPHNNVEVCL